VEEKDFQLLFSLFLLAFVIITLFAYFGFYNQPVVVLLF